MDPKAIIATPIGEKLIYGSGSVKEHVNPFLSSFEIIEKEFRKKFGSNQEEALRYAITRGKSILQDSPYGSNQHYRFYREKVASYTLHLAFFYAKRASFYLSQYKGMLENPLKKEYELFIEQLNKQLFPYFAMGIEGEKNNTLSYFIVQQIRSNFKDRLREEKVKNNNKNKLQLLTLGKDSLVKAQKLYQIFEKYELDKTYSCNIAIIEAFLDKHINKPDSELNRLSTLVKKESAKKKDKKKRQQLRKNKKDSEQEKETNNTVLARENKVANDNSSLMLADTEKVEDKNSEENSKNSQQFKENEEKVLLEEKKPKNISQPNTSIDPQGIFSRSQKLIISQRSNNREFLAPEVATEGDGDILKDFPGVLHVDFKLMEKGGPNGKDKYSSNVQLYDPFRVEIDSIKKEFHGNVHTKRKIDAEMLGKLIKKYANILAKKKDEKIFPTIKSYYEEDLAVYYLALSFFHARSASFFLSQYVKMVGKSHNSAYYKGFIKQLENQDVPHTYTFEYKENNSSRDALFLQIKNQYQDDKNDNKVLSDTEELNCLKEIYVALIKAQKEYSTVSSLPVLVNLPEQARGTFFGERLLAIKTFLDNYFNPSNSRYQQLLRADNDRQKKRVMPSEQKTIGIELPHKPTIEKPNKTEDIAKNIVSHEHTIMVQVPPAGELKRLSTPCEDEKGASAFSPAQRQYWNSRNNVFLFNANKERYVISFSQRANMRAYAQSELFNIARYYVVLCLCVNRAYPSRDISFLGKESDILAMCEKMLSFNKKHDNQTKRRHAETPAAIFEFNKNEINNLLKCCDPLIRLDNEGVAVIYWLALAHEFHRYPHEVDNFIRIPLVKLFLMEQIGKKSYDSLINTIVPTYVKAFANSDRKQWPATTAASGWFCVVEALFYDGCNDEQDIRKKIVELQLPMSADWRDNFIVKVCAGLQQQDIQLNLS